jgi:hypothetical protein
MSHIHELHQQAMDLAEMAQVAKFKGDLDQGAQLFRQAFNREASAAELIANNFAAEPTCSILYRSAASLAIDCGEFYRAKHLIKAAQQGNPPTEIMEELKDLSTQINEKDRLLK